MEATQYQRTFAVGFATHDWLVGTIVVEHTHSGTGDGTRIQARQIRAASACDRHSALIRHSRHVGEDHGVGKCQVRHRDGAAGAREPVTLEHKLNSAGTAAHSLGYVHKHLLIAHNAKLL